MDALKIAACAFLGGMLWALLGWADSHEKFNGRKFLSSAIRSLFAAVVFAVGYQFKPELTWLDYFAALITGATFDVAVNRIGSALGNPQWPLPHVSGNAALGIEGPAQKSPPI
jgi:hypothetical protein